MSSSHPFSSCEKIGGLGTLHFVFYNSIKFETKKKKVYFWGTDYNMKGKMAEGVGV